MSPTVRTLSSLALVAGALVVCPELALADDAKPAAPPAAPTAPPVEAPTPAAEAAPVIATPVPTAATPSEPPPNSIALGARNIPSNSWRHSIRAAEGETSYPWFEADHVVFELRFGPYYAEVDEEFAATNEKPFETYFGEDARLYFGIELDWVPLYLRYVGSFGFGFGWGYTRFGGYSYATSSDDDGLGATTESETGLNIFPMHASVVARFDGMLRELSIPVVPYVKGGLGMGYWNAVGASGTSEASDDSGVTTVGEGVTLGTHFAVGAALALNAFDPTAASTMRSQTGLNYAYVFGEWMRADLDGLGADDQMHIGDETAVFGLALDW